jgi:hypothetical protein
VLCSKNYRAGVAVGTTTSIDWLVLHQTVLVSAPSLFHLFQKLFLSFLLLPHVLEPPVLYLLIKIFSVYVMSRSISCDCACCRSLLSEVPHAFHLELDTGIRESLYELTPILFPLASDLHKTRALASAREVVSLGFKLDYMLTLKEFRFHKCLIDMRWESLKLKSHQVNLRIIFYCM